MWGDRKKLAAGSDPVGLGWVGRQMAGGHLVLDPVSKGGQPAASEEPASKT